MKRMAFVPLGSLECWAPWKRRTGSASFTAALSEIRTAQIGSPPTPVLPSLSTWKMAGYCCCQIWNYLRSGHSGGSGGGNR